MFYFLNIGNFENFWTYIIINIILYKPLNLNLFFVE